MANNTESDSSFPQISLQLSDVRRQISDLLCVERHNPSLSAQYKFIRGLIDHALTLRDEQQISAASQVSKLIAMMNPTNFEKEADGFEWSK
jgi:hypothetical protein